MKKEDSLYLKICIHNPEELSLELKLKLIDALEDVIVGYLPEASIVTMTLPDPETVTPAQAMGAEMELGPIED